MKLVLLPQFTLIAMLLINAIAPQSLKAEQLNCFEFKQGSIKFLNCDHNCSSDKKARFNSSGKCSVCGHTVKKQPDFFIETATHNDSHHNN